MQEKLKRKKKRLKCDRYIFSKDLNLYSLIKALLCPFFFYEKNFSSKIILFVNLIWMKKMIGIILKWLIFTSFKMWYAFSYFRAKIKRNYVR